MDIKKARQAQWIIDKCMISEAREMEKLFPDYFEQGHAYFLPRDPNSYAVFELGNAKKVIEKIRAEVDQAIMDDTTCDCCGKKMTELKPFGGPDDPTSIAEGTEHIFQDQLLVSRGRPVLPYDEEVEKALDKVRKEELRHRSKEDKEAIEKADKALLEASKKWADLEKKGDEKAIKKAFEEVHRRSVELNHAADRISDWCSSWLIDKYGKERAKEIGFYGSAQTISKSFECRDCFMLDDNEFFKKRGRVVNLDS